jgi:hypothetical protein
MIWTSTESLGKRFYIVCAAAALRSDNPSDNMTFISRHLCLFATLALFNPGANAACVAGARTPFWTLEAEGGTLGGGATVRSFTPGDPVPPNPTPELESSGRAFVELTSPGDSVSLVNPGSSASTIVIRAAIPDAPAGGGTTATLNLYVDGGFRQAITLSSAQTWVYGTNNGMSNDPAAGPPHVFFDETRAWISGDPVASGSTITLQQDVENTAAFYWIDCIDLETPPDQRSQPDNSLSVVDFGAIPDDGTDDTVAIQNCINAAQAQGMSVWIPAGVFSISNRLAATGVTIEGAGMWYTTLYRNVPLPTPPGLRSELNVASGVVRDLFIDGNAVSRRREDGSDYGINIGGASGWLIERVWIQHATAAIWASGTDGVVRDCRVSHTWADGINLNNGSAYNADKLGRRLTAQNNFVRGAGDDSFAINSTLSGGAVNMEDARLLNNTSIAPWWANGLRIAGGKSSIVQDNFIADPTTHNGMIVAIFGPTGAPLDGATITGNIIVRGAGSVADTAGMSLGSGTQYSTSTITGNLIQDSLRAGIRLGPTFLNTTIAFNLIDHPATKGIWIKSGVTGTGSFECNPVIGLNPGQVEFQNDSPATFTPTVVGCPVISASSWPSATARTYVPAARPRRGQASGLPLQPGRPRIDSH